MRQDKSSRSRREAIVACCQTVVFAIYPVLFALQLSVGLPLRAAGVIRSAIAAVMAAAALLWALRMLEWNLPGRATWLSWVLVLFGLYVPAVAAGRAGGLPVYIGHVWFSLGYALTSFVIASAIVRPWTGRPHGLMPLTAAATVLVTLTLYPIFSSMLAHSTTRGTVLAERIIEGASRVANHGRADRDVYYIILDGFGRRDVLAEHYGEALDSFSAHLTSRGFYVAEQAQSNYAQTFLSLSSTLNMTYLDELADVMGPSSRNRLPLQHLIQQNALMKLAKKAGYRVIVVGSDYMATKRLDEADVCYCQQYGLDEFEQTVAGLTPMAAFPFRRWTYGAHRRKVLSSFAAIEQASTQPGPKFVLAHIVSPHPPFVLGPDSRAEAGVAGHFMFGDGDDYQGSRSEYVAGYRRQVQFVAARLQGVVDQVLGQAGPPPVVVIHGDHGPGSRLHWDDPRATDMHERMGIFAAYRFPDGPDQELYPTLSPVNGARMLANRYLGSDLPLLPDRSYFSTLAQPFQLIPVSFPQE